MDLLLAVALGSLPGFVWLLFYTHEDFRGHRHGFLTALSFLLGAVSTFAVFVVQTRLSNAFSFISGDPHGFPSFLVLGGVEEIMKFLAFYLFIRPQRKFQKLHEPIDAMVSMVAVALGFATVENIASVSQILDGYGFGPSVFETIILRFLGATLLHTLSSALFGYYWAKAAFRGRRNVALYFETIRAGNESSSITHPAPQRKAHFGYFLEGLALATVLHAIFNYLIIVNGPTGIAIVFLVCLSFFVLNDFEKAKHPQPAS